MVVICGHDWGFEPDGRGAVVVEVGLVIVICGVSIRVADVDLALLSVFFEYRISRSRSCLFCHVCFQLWFTSYADNAYNIVGSIVVYKWELPD
jgi:hypothetical protein